MPSDLIAAISHAAMILTWHEHLLDKEIPPKWMWCLDEELNAHFDWVKAERAEPDHDIEPRSGPMLENEYAKNRGRNAR